VDKVIKIIRNATTKGGSDQGVSSSPTAGGRHPRHAAAHAAKLEHIKIEQELRIAEGAEGPRARGSRTARRSKSSWSARSRRTRDFRDKRRTRIGEAEKARGRDAGDRRTGHGDLLEERLGARTPGVGRRSSGALVQGGRRARGAGQCRTVDPVVFLDSPTGARTPVEAARFRPRAATVRRPPLAGEVRKAQIMHCLAGKARRPVVGGGDPRLRIVAKLGDMPVQPQRRDGVHEVREGRHAHRAVSVRGRDRAITGRGVLRGKCSRSIWTRSAIPKGGRHADRSRTRARRSSRSLSPGQAERPAWTRPREHRRGRREGIRALRLETGPETAASCRTR